MRHHNFADGASLAKSLASDVASALERRLEADGSASLVVSGGRTPAEFLRELAHRSLDWSRVNVTLADERCVPRDHPASNQKLVRDAFAGSPAAHAHLLDVDATSADAAERWGDALSAFSKPYAAVVLGMGDDGHFASLFPGMPGLADALALTTPAAVVRGRAPVEPRDRLSLTLSALLDTDLLALHVTGPSKLATLQRASCPGSPLEMPVRALLEQRRVVLEIYHAP